jgi:hypothetical protein
MGQKRRVYSYCTILLLVTTLLVPLGIITFSIEGGIWKYSKWWTTDKATQSSSVPPLFNHTFHHVSPETMIASSFLSASQHVLQQQQQEQQPLITEIPQSSIRNSPNHTPVREQMIDTTQPSNHNAHTTNHTRVDPLLPRNLHDDDMALPTWLTSYIEFHRSHMVVVPPRRKRRTHDDGSVLEKFRWNRSHDDNDEHHPTVHMLTYHCHGRSCGGLGDRLAGIVQAFYMAVCTHRLFFIDWHMLTDFVRPHSIPWHADTTTTTTSHHVLREDDNTIWIRAMDDRNNTILREPHTLPNGTHIRLETNLWMGDHFVTSPCWQNYIQQFHEYSSSSSSTPSRWTEHELYRMAFHTLFQWSPEVLQSVTQLRQRAQLLQTSTTANVVVAMHIRTGLLDVPSKIWTTRGNHHVPLPAERHGNPLEWMQFLQCSHKLREGLLALCDTADVSTVVDLYLATDHVSVKEYLQKEDTSIKMILDLNIHHVDQRGSHSDGEMAAWSEFVLLQEALCIVKSHSKYSETAAVLSAHPGCAVYFDDCTHETVMVAIDSVRNHIKLQCT